jgi:hypothetical protein
MTTQEFSIEFDILYNNLASNTAPPLNEYEKSVFLTKAQSDIVLELYSGRNNLGLAFESSAEVRRYLHPLVKQNNITLIPGSDGLYDIQGTSISDVFVIIREYLRHNSGETPVVPVTQDEYSKIKQNPFRGPKCYKRALRLEQESKISIAADLPIETSTQYVITYLKNPDPIILENLPTDDIGKLTIQNASSASNGELPESLHRMILDRAVLYAKQAYVGGQAQRAQQE